MKWPWPWRARSAAQGERIAITLREGQLDLVASRAGGIVASRSVMNAELDAEVVSFCEMAGMSAPACSLVLPTGSYQMLLVEAPPVPAEELAQALRWKVKDLLHSPLEQTIVDGFLLPEDAYRGRQKMAYTVAAEKSPLQQLVGKLEKVGLRVDRVLIPELVMAQTVNDCLHDEHTEIVLVIGREKSFLSVFSGGAIYLTRNIAVTEDTLKAAGVPGAQTEELLESFLLELQRSRDYFESQLGKGVIGRILIMPTENNTDVVSAAVKERLRISVETINADAITGGAAAYSLHGVEPLLLATASQAA